MAFSYGFFNAQNLDRVYTAEDFTAYLSSLICNGILDTYRQCFAPTVKNLSVTFGTGKAWMVEPLARAAIAVGADGVMIEVHNDPVHALCDGQQSITPDMFAQVMADIRVIAKAVGREV